MTLKRCRALIFPKIENDIRDEVDLMMQEELENLNALYAVKEEEKEEEEKGQEEEGKEGEEEKVVRRLRSRPTIHTMHCLTS